MAEDLASYYTEVGVRCRYMHSEIETIERIKLLRDLRKGEFDVLIGINLLREGLDLPEVSLVAILDADKEGFLRSQGSLIQTIGRAARHVEGRAILYADKMTDSMRRAIDETDRRREKQVTFNEENGITPMSIVRPLEMGLAGIMKADYIDLTDEAEGIPEFATQAELESYIEKLESDMREAARKFEFEKAVKLRDTVKELRTQGVPLQLELDAALRQDAALVGVLHLAHLGDRVCQLDQQRVGVASGEDDVDHLRLAAQDLGDGFGREHLVADGVVDLVEHDQVPVAGEDCGGSLGPGGLDQANVFGVCLCAADLDEAAAKLPNDEVLRGRVAGRRAEGLACAALRSAQRCVQRIGGIQLAVVPRTLEELEDEDAHAVAGGAQCGAQRGGGLALAGAGVDQDETAASSFGSGCGVRHRFSVARFAGQWPEW